ncbi:MAG: undecaprenyl-diphosphate phosphatase [Verrucomicrobia bacterium]|nr:undecaprenyl-diphosphate phosphatase [Verrucomicrobiota bacterium]
MPDWLSVLLLGIIEGITEFLPVSSTGHLLLAERWLPRQTDLFNVVIQSGAVIAVLPLFPERCRQLVCGWRDPSARNYLLKLTLAFALTGLGGLILDTLHFTLPETVLPVATALVVGGLLFLGVERWLRGQSLHHDIPWTVAALVGAGQLLAAVFPGLSRSGATILLMLACGISRPAATEFAFLVGVPTLLAAGALKIVRALHTPMPLTPPEDWGMLLWGTAVSAAVSFLAVKWLLRYVQTHTFVLFGGYRIAVGALVLALAR